MSFVSKEAKERIYSSLLAVVVIGLINWLWPKVIPFDLLHFWKVNGSVVIALKNSWFLFVWGATLPVLRAIFAQSEDSYRIIDTEIGLRKKFFQDVSKSLWAGFSEEIYFRWLVFYSLIPALTFLNWIFFGWRGFGVFEWLYLNALGPTADLLTLGYLKSILFNQYGWMVGAAVVATNSKFRDGHKYQGLFGWVNSWFGGMYLFYVMFTYGLPSAILVHFLYNFSIDVALYVKDLISMKVHNADQDQTIDDPAAEPGAIVSSVNVLQIKDGVSYSGTIQIADRHLEFDINFLGLDLEHTEEMFQGGADKVKGRVELHLFVEDKEIELLDDEFLLWAEYLGKIVIEFFQEESVRARNTGFQKVITGVIGILSKLGFPYGINKTYDHDILPTEQERAILRRPKFGISDLVSA